MNDSTSLQGRVRSCAPGVANAPEWFGWTLYATFSVSLAGNLADKTGARSAMLAEPEPGAYRVFSLAPWHHQATVTPRSPASLRRLHQSIGASEQPGLTATVLGFERSDLVTLQQGQANIIQSLEQAVFTEGVDLEA